MRLMLMPFSRAATDTVPVTLASSVTRAPRLVRNLSGSRKLETPTCWMGTGAPATASVAAIMSGSSAR